MNKHLSLKSIEEMLANIPDDPSKNQATLVGGQALVMWVAHFEERELLKQTSLLLSSDVDFLGTYTTLQNLAEAWNGKDIVRAEAFDPTPNAGIFTATDPDGNDRYVDILRNIYGIKDSEIDKFTDNMQITSGDKTASIKILSPPLLLASRVKNLELYKKQGNDLKVEREIKARIPAAKKITKQYITRLLDVGDIKKALHIVKFLNEHGLVASVPQNHPNWPEKFKEIQLPRLLGQQREKDAKQLDLKSQEITPRPAQPGVRYTGLIIAINKGTAIQKFGKSLIAHQISTLNKKVEKDKSYGIFHNAKNGKAEVKEIKKSQTKSINR